jgi:hypothetical protein
MQSADLRQGEGNVSFRWAASVVHILRREGAREKEIKREGEGNREGIREQEQGKWHECVYVKESEIIFYFIYLTYI